MPLSKIRAQAEIDVDYRHGMMDEEEFSNFLVQCSIEKSENLYDHYIYYYNEAIDLACE
jgi:hypothetical protein